MRVARKLRERSIANAFPRDPASPKHIARNVSHRYWRQRMNSLRAQVLDGDLVRLDDLNYAIQMYIRTRPS